MRTSNTTAAPAGFSRLGQAGALFAVLGLVGIVIAALLAQSNPERIKDILQSYLYGWVLAMLLALGCFGFMLMYYASRATWGKSVLRLFEAGARALPVMFVLYLPLLLWGRYLYPWANPDLVHGNAALGIKADETLIHRAGYMNVTMVLLRTLIYFFIWSILAYVLSGMSRRQDETGDLRLEADRQKISAVGFLIYVITATLAFTDWVMSLDTHWFSTIFGFWFIDFQGLATIAFVTLIVCRYKMARKEPYDTLVDHQATRDLGNLMLTLTMIWAYFSLSQWLIIWSGNLPEEITFYLKRNSGTFLLVGAANIILSFFLPFVLLLSGNNKRSPAMLAAISVLVLIMRLVDIFWVIIPLGRHPIGLHGTDIAGAAFGIGVFLAAFTYMVGQTSIVPNHEIPVDQEVLAHG